VLQTLHFILLPKLIAFPTGLLVVCTNKQASADIKSLAKNIDHHKQGIADAQ
jgi:hypothetical protein